MEKWTILLNKDAQKGYSIMEYEEKEMVFGRFRCKSKLDVWITLAEIRTRAEPSVPLTGMDLELMSEALRTFASPNKRALLDGRGIDMIYVEEDNKKIRHMVMVIDGEHTPFSINTLAGYTPKKEHIQMRKQLLRMMNAKPYEIIEDA